VTTTPLAPDDAVVDVDLVLDASPSDDADTGRDAAAGGGNLVITLLMVSTFVVILNETLMGVALPTLMDGLSISASTAQWLSTGFMLTMAVVIPATGILLERFTSRAMFIAAMSLFSTGTLLAAVAPGFGVLMLGRIVQAGGTAVMIPLLMTTVLTTVAPSRRGQMMGLISVVIGVAPAIGPTISGLILELAGWRWIFWFVLPIALFSLALGATKIRNVTVTRHVRVDALSIVLSIFGFGGLIYGLASIGEAANGHAPVPLWLPLTVGAVSLAGFVGRQLSLQRSDRALLDLRPFTNRTFSISIVLMAISMLTLFGALIILPIYLQTVLDLSTLTTGLMLLPGGLVMGLTAPFVGRAFDRVGPRPLVIPGVIVISASLWSMTVLDESSSGVLVIATHVGLSFGFGLMLTPLMTSALGSLKQSLYSHGSAIVSTVQQLAGAAGTALFITMLATQTAAQEDEGATETVAAASGVHAALLVGAGISVVAIALSFFIRRPAGDVADAPLPVH
jgi:DHA2 family lincomycin resistance protein-like MFS transporter